MTNDLALQLMSQMLWNALLIGGPVLLLAMAVGVLISIIQVVTQIQDASLAFVPKLLAVFAILVAFGPWMLRRLVAYTATLIAGIPALF
ncbi:flagellar biosynthesis protein FliQ [Neisseriaceae bacterium TC5R-5]|nr:flagellar biosynthesis protein FliQ [Neisseriaceae bacterium TC5R-5]